MTRTLAIGIAIKLRENGHEDMADAVLISFDCYLRASEIVTLRGADVHIRGRLDPPTAPAATLRLANTKTGANQAVSVRRPLALAAVRRRLKHAPGAVLFSFSYKQYLAAWHEALSDLGIGQLGLLLHGLRHGGATDDHVNNGVPLQDVVLRGRWTNARTAARYIQVGQALSASLALPRPAQIWLTARRQQ